MGGDIFLKNWNSTMRFVQFNFTEMNEVMHIMKRYNCTIHKNELRLFCKIQAGIAKFRLAEVLHELENIQNVDYKRQNSHLTKSFAHYQFFATLCVFIKTLTGL